MGKLEIMAHSSEQRERRHRRFPLRYPVHLQFESCDTVSEMEGESRNISISGLLLATEAPVPWNCSVTFTLTLYGEQMVRAIEIAGQGRVVRVQPGEEGTGFAIAVQCNRPLIEIAHLA